jgi:hypothetical protein
MPDQQHSRDEEVGDTHGNTRMGDVQNTRVPEENLRKKEEENLRLLFRLKWIDRV